VVAEHFNWGRFRKAAEVFKFFFALVHMHVFSLGGSTHIEDD
jgi:hypothetical protein